jgi:polyhydroxyalkanoate synthesis regulator phasin
MRPERIVEQVDKMVRSGRITPEEAERLRATEGTTDFEAAVAAIRARHAGAHMSSAVANGVMSQEEADGYVERLRKGEHPVGLRARLRAVTHRPAAETGS